MNRILSKFSLVIASTLITAGVWAQSPAVKATIPFDFTVNNTTVPAGTYTVSEESMTGNILKFSAGSQHVDMLAAVLPTEAKTKGRDVLVFHKYGDHYFLREIRCQSCAMNSYLPESKAERWQRIQAQDSVAKIAPPSATDVLIALR